MEKLTQDQIKQLIDSRPHPIHLLAKYLEESNYDGWFVAESARQLRDLLEKNKALEQDAFRYRALRAYKKSDFGFDSAESMDSLADQMVDLGNPDAKQSD